MKPHLFSLESRKKKKDKENEKKMKGPSSVKKILRATLNHFHDEEKSEYQWNYLFISNI